MTLTPAQRFSETAGGYAATMVPSLRPIAGEVVRRALTDEMLAVTPRTPEGGYRIPFGTIYLTARKSPLAPPG
ncbi:MAG: hypothetical protein ACRDGV_07300 [Candidatus Limnocylindria bacterium]